MARDLLVVIVSWNVVHHLTTCLDSVLAQLEPADGGWRLGGRAVEVCVVDNASTDGSPELVRERYPGVHLLEADGNLGFARANNLALRRFPAALALLLNPDARLEAGALARMVHYIEAHPEVAVVGPRLQYGDGLPQPSRRRFPTLMTGLMESTLLEQWFPRNRWARRYRYEGEPEGGAAWVDWVVGACMLVRGEAMKQVGLLDEGFFMYSEELDWCRRMHAAGWRVAYLPEALVTHFEGQSSQQVAPRRHVVFQSSKVRYYRKHHGALSAEALRLFLLGTYAWQWAEEALKYLLGHRRGLRRERLRAYAQVLRSGLRPPADDGGG